MEFMTFELTSNGQALILKTNDLINLDSVDYLSVVIYLTNITHVIQEVNSSDGLNIVMSNGHKYNISPDYVTMVGANDYKLLPSFTCPDNETLLNDLVTLIGW